LEIYLMKNRKRLKTKLITAVSFLGTLIITPPAFAIGDNVITKWNDAALDAIRQTHPGPPIVARALAVTHTCMYDAWAAYDSRAKGTRYGENLRRPKYEQTILNKQKAVSYAAYQCLSDLFPTEVSKFKSLMTSLSYDPNDTAVNINSPVGVGNVAAKAVLDFRHQDGSNQLGDLHPGFYSDYTGYAPVNTPTDIIDPNHWQPLEVNGKVQTFIAPHWGKVIPYAMHSGNQYRRLLPKPANYF
jgi:hypothetical protein